ncbi:OB-fold domain-containing protein [Streptomyces sp. CA-210063]|uniref:Zn-ribbon domain-containing OB-fold protein n=1 Tax=Streptomyces sp. CA-210063 TaxID=2801029 RepID=UPI00214CD6B7|nr:OB-fold domain-containing protein [Streptomyces sp. CA-210063]UUU28703.1 OB-fold domain-containing protein [Streptomyces sp. CA-210063]
MTLNQKPVAEGLFTWPPDATAPPRLIGSECVACGLISFPAAADCVRCASQESRQRLLSDRGTLWTYTTQNFRPPSPPYDGPDAFEPYAVGYIELPGELLVEARLTEPDPEKLKVGQDMRLTLVPYAVRDDGTEVVTFAFTPMEKEGS